MGPTEKQREEGREDRSGAALTERDWWCVGEKKQVKKIGEKSLKPEWEIPSGRRSVNHMKIG